MKNQIIFKFIAVFISISIVLGLSEIAVRSVCDVDADGNYWMGARLLKPFKVPEKEVLKNVNNSDKVNAIFHYDALIGWTPKPGSFNQGFNVHNSMGVRVNQTNKVYAVEKEKGVLRIALFGDSYMYSSEVAFEKSIGFYLEEDLKKAGFKAEVINFGVGAYGMDQAFLRWLYQGQKYRPDIVVVGIQPENAFRNVNLLRAFYSKKEALPFSKPRFIQNKDTLAIINQPCLKPEQLPAALHNIQKWPLVSYESFYDPEDYENKIILKSKLMSCLLNAIAINRFRIRNDEIRAFQMDKAPASLTIKILETFKRMVDRSGSAFITVHLPRKQDLKDIKEQKILVYADLLKGLERKMPVIRTGSALIKGSQNKDVSDLFEVNGHYSGKGNCIVAKEISHCVFMLRNGSKP